MSNIQYETLERGAWRALRRGEDVPIAVQEGMDYVVLRKPDNRGVDLGELINRIKNRFKE